MNFTAYADQLDNLTVIILSKERSRLLGYTLSYWAKLPCKVIVVHDAQVSLEKYALGDRVKYILCNESILYRLGKAAFLVQTPYVVIANDDEIYLPSALRQIISHLESNPELDACGGQALAYTWAGSKLLALPIYPFLRNYSNTLDSSRERVSKTIKSKNWMDLLSVHRTSNFKRVVKEVMKFDGFSTPYMYEVMFSLFLSLFGKTLRLNLLYWGRNWFEPYHSDLNKWNREVTWKTWLIHEDFRLERIKWRKILQDCLTEIKQKSTADSLEAVRWLEEEFNVAFGEQDELEVRNSGRFFNILRQILNLFNSNLVSLYRWKAQSLLPRLRNRVMPRFEIGIERLRQSDTEIFDQDLKLFVSFINEQKFIATKS